MARKTVSVEAIRAQANMLLALEDGPGTPASEQGIYNRMYRRGVIAMVERVLFDTDNYKGFQYLDSEFVPSATEYGRRELREDYDPTRVRYY